MASKGHIPSAGYDLYKGHSRYMINVKDTLDLNRVTFLFSVEIDVLAVTIGDDDFPFFMHRILHDNEEHLLFL